MVNKKIVVVGIVAIIAVSVILTAMLEKRGASSRLRDTSSVEAADPEKRSPQADKKTGNQLANRGLAAIDRAVEAKRFIFIFFYKDNDEQTSKMRKVFDAAMKKLADKAESIAINLADPSEKKLVERFGVDGAPMPIVLAVAPNGIVTAGFPKEFGEEELFDALVGSGLQKCLKALQEQKVAVVCVQGKTTKSNAEAMKGVEDFKADVWYGGLVEIIQVDPADTAEEKLLAQLQITPKQEDAVTVLIAPPGRMIGRFTGATDKNTLVNAYMNAPGLGGCGT